MKRQHHDVKSSPFFTPSFLSAMLCMVTALFVTPLLPAQTAVPLHTSGRLIVDSNGNAVHLHAFSWYGGESSDYVVGGLQVATLSNVVKEFKSLGFNAVRLPWSNQLYESNPVVGSFALAANPSLQGQRALSIMDQVISALTGEGLMVILDNHNSNAEWCCGNDGNALWYTAQYPESSWIGDWQGMASRYKSNRLVIGADLRNEPRGTATWGGSSTTDWRAAAERGGNAVLGVNSNLLIFVEGVNFAEDLSGAASKPIQLNTANRVVYEAHDYGFDYSGLSSYSTYVNDINYRWGYLVTGSNPQPLWVGEFGTCNTANTCVSSTSSSDNGAWFGFITTFLQQNNVDWAYWAINGTESTGSGRTYGKAENYGVLNTSWNGSALSALTARLQSIMNAGSGGGANLIANGTYTISNKNSGLVIDVPGSSTTEGTYLDQYSSNGGNNQKWKLTNLGNNNVELVNVTSGYALEVYGQSTATGAMIDQWPYSSGTNQIWTIVSQGGGYYELINKHSGLALEVPGLSKTVGVDLDQWTPNGGSNQLWAFK